jgi:AAA domain
VKGWLFYATPKGLKLAEIKDGSRQAGALETALRAAIERRRPDLLGLDPFVKLHALEENDNGAMDFVCDLLVKLAIEYDIAVDAPHHAKKGQLTPGDADSGRGASSMRDAGRLMYTLTTMSEEEAKRFDINPDERASYIRLDKGKVNLAPPARTATWFKLVGVPLLNGTAEYPSVGATQALGWARFCDAQRGLDRHRPRDAERAALRRLRGPVIDPRGRWCRSIARNAPRPNAERSSERGSGTAFCSNGTMTIRSSVRSARASTSTRQRGLHERAPSPHF